MISVLDFALSLFLKNIRKDRSGTTQDVDDGDDNFQIALECSGKSVNCLFM